MECEDDIYILQQSGDEQELTSGPRIARTSSYPLGDTIVDPGSHHALQKAYFELKKRLNETTIRNQQLTKRVLELESARDFSSDLGGSYDMMEDNSFIAEGGAAMPVTADPQIAAEEGYIHMLKRDLTRSKQQIQAIEKQYQESMQKNEANSDMLAQKVQESEARLLAALREKDRIQQALETSEKQKEQAIWELAQKCQSLEVEKSIAEKEAMSLSDDLKKAKQELEELKERQGDSCAGDAPPEVVKEVAHLRQVIDSLKRMVLAQRSYLTQMESRSSMSMRNSLSQSMKDPSSVDQDMSPPTSNRSGPGQSWELMNGAHPQSSPDAQKQQQQRQQQYQQQPAIGQQRPVSAGDMPQLNQPGLPANFSSSAASQNVMNGGPDASRTAMGSGQQWGRVGNVYNGQIMSTGQNVTPGQLPRRASTEVMCRKSEEEVQERRSKTEMIRSQPPQQPLRSSKLADWMGNHYQQQGGANVSGGQVVQTGYNQHQAVTTDFNQPPQQGMVTNNSASQQRLSQQAPMQYKQGQPYPYPQHHQMSPGRDLPSTYDNMHYPNGHPAGSVGSSIHVLNQTGMAGARVVRTGSDSFGSSRSTPTGSGSYLQAGSAATLSRDGGQRGLPQEHSDLNMRSRTASPHPTDLLPPTNTRQSSEAHDPSAEDRKCPVCSQDFTHISMDDFQTHVFECFDDADESTGPETLLPHKTSSSTDRICPMCNKKFDDNVTQQYFEGHVQSHFEEAVDPFEVLHTNP